MSDLHKTQNNSVDTCINTNELQNSIKSSQDNTNSEDYTGNDEMCPKTKNCLFIGAVSVPVVIILAICIPILFCVAIAIFPLLLISLVVTRLVQFIRHDEHGYIKAFQVKLIIRNALCIDVLFILLGIGLMYLFRVYDDDFFMVIIICGFYLLSFVLLKLVHAILIKTRDHVFVETISEIIDCLVFLWAAKVLDESLFDFDGREITWVEVLIFYLISYNLITLFTHLVVFALSSISRQKNKKFKVIMKKLNDKYLVYYANGLKWSIDFVLSILLLLVAWVCYVDRDLIENDESPPPTSTSAPTPSQSQTLQVLKDLIKGKGVWGFCEWSLVSLLICAFLWLFKTVLLLAWKAHTVYDRLRQRILENGVELYCLSVLGDNFHIFKQDRDLRTKKKEQVRKVLLPHQNKVNNEPTVDDVKRIVEYFLIARTHLQKETYISSILQKVSDLDKNSLEQTLKEIDKEMEIMEVVEKESSCGPRKKITSIFCGCVYTVFSFICFSNIKRLRNYQGKEKFDEDKSDDQTNFAKELLLKKDGVGQELVRAHSRCLILANTLSSAKELSSCLNNIIIGLILVATFIIWLLLTGLTTREFIVVFASSLLAGTFIFGNTCKTLFQSLIFVFVVHPFDVGDLCVIDDILLEVKNVGIWKTIFSKVGWQEEVIYPNVQLSNKKIINHKTDIDWNEHIEFEVGSSNKEKIIELKKEIEVYLGGDKAKFAPGYNCVEAMKCPTGDNFKIVIDFRHNTNLKNTTYFECVKKKRKLRSDFAFKIQKLLDKMEISGSNNSVDASSINKVPIEEKPEEDCDEKPKDNKDEEKSKPKEDCDCKCVKEKAKTDDGSSQSEDKKGQGVSEITEEEKQN